HRDLGAVGEDEVRTVGELLYDAEDVVTSPRVETASVIAQLIEDLVHLEGGQDRLYQHRAFDRPTAQIEGVFRECKHVVPKSGFQMALQFRKVEVGTGPLGQQAAGIMKNVEPEVEERAGHRLPVDLEVPFRQMPSAWAHQQGGQPFPQAIRLPVWAGEGDRSIDRINQVHLAADHVAPRWCVRVLEALQHRPAHIYAVQRCAHLTTRAPCWCVFSRCYRYLIAVTFGCRKDSR